MNLQVDDVDMAFDLESFVPFHKDKRLSANIFKNCIPWFKRSTLSCLCLDEWSLFLSSNM